MYKVWIVFKELKKINNLQAYPIKLKTKFPSRLDEAEAFANLFLT